MFKNLFSFSHTKRLFPALFFGSYLASNSRTLFNCSINKDSILTFKSQNDSLTKLVPYTKSDLTPEELIFFYRIKTNYLYENFEDLKKDLQYLNSSEYNLDMVDLLAFYKVSDFTGNAKNFSDKFKKYILENYTYKFYASPATVVIKDDFTESTYISLHINCKKPITPSPEWNNDENKFICYMNEKKIGLDYSINIFSGDVYKFIFLMNLFDKNMYISPAQFIKFNYKFTFINKITKLQKYE